MSNATNNKSNNKPNTPPAIPGLIRFAARGRVLTAAEVLTALSLAADMADLTERAAQHVNAKRMEDHTLRVLGGTANADILG